MEMLLLNVTIFIAYFVNYTYKTIFHFAEFVTNCDLMWKQSVWTSVFASRLASRHLSR